MTWLAGSLLVAQRGLDTDWGKRKQPLESKASAHTGQKVLLDPLTQFISSQPFWYVRVCFVLFIWFFFFLFFNP